jgi:hypothetical protein
MEKPQDDKKKGETKEGQGKGTSLDFLKIDRSLRPDGCHFEAEMGAGRSK